MRNPFSSLLIAGAVLALAGCTGARKPPDRLIDEIYDDVHRAGAQDAVDALRAGMGERQAYGIADPYIPLRTPDEIVPIWVVPHVDPRTGRRVSGHWEHTVIRRGEWFTD